MRTGVRYGNQSARVPGSYGERYRDTQRYLYRYNDGRIYQVQYFERARFEWHAGAWPERYDVLLGRLAADALEDELDRVAEQVEEDLLELPGVAAEKRRGRWGARLCLW